MVWVVLFAAGCLATTGGRPLPSPPFYNKEQNVANTQQPEIITYNPEMINYHHAWETVQGEGPYVGRPAVFVRLAGCNLSCSFCDTEYTKERSTVSYSVLTSIVKDIRRSGLVVITGGEPMRQDISLFVGLLLSEDYDVQIETNGTVYRDLPWDHPNLTMVCSPKSVGRVLPKLASRVTAWKFVVGAPVNINGNGLSNLRLTVEYMESLQIKWDAPVFVQPRDDGNEAANQINLDLALVIVARHDWRLSLQTHKLIGLE
jgi:organic radical activating enzyme